MMNNEPVGPLRVWLRDVNVPGLCMTRSLGDNLAGTVGVIDIPEVMTYNLDPQDRYLLLMSDGIYEFIENEELMEMIHTVRT
jgi:serine/threonine protein phosphatase PrpC